jgi:uncharacterized membrane protein
MPLWVLLIKIGFGLIVLGSLIDSFYKSKAKSLNTQRLSEETKANMGLSSSFM